MDEKTKEKSLELLKFIEYHCSHLADDYLKKVKKDGFLEITFGDIKNLDHSVFGDIKNLYIISEVLQREGLNLSVRFDLVNDIPEAFIDKHHPPVGDVVLVLIKGDNVKKIISKIHKIKNKLSETENTIKSFKIIVYTKNAVLSVNSIDLPFLEGSLEWSLIMTLVKEDRPICFDEIIEYHYRGDENLYSEKQNKKSVYDSHKKINKKIIKNTDLKTDLIKNKKNQYQFLKKVTKK